jgi:hypothetical protein
VNRRRLCVCGHRWPAHAHHRVGTECAICGPDACARFRWHWWPWASTIAAAVVVVAGCAAIPSPRPAPSTDPRPPVPCVWYSGFPSGQQVIVAITGPDCHGGMLALMSWIARHTGRVWDSTHLAPMGQLLATETRSGSVIRVWFTGPPSGSAGPAAGRLADALLAAGWSPQTPAA